MKKVLICDFEDSFTYNIYAHLKTMFNKSSIEVITYQNISAQLVTNYDVLVLGPGPGHPKDYRDFLDKLCLKKILKHTFILGICLGHQVFWSEHGAVIERCLHPIHAQKCSYDLKGTSWQKYFEKSDITVQRYNSLGVKLNPKDKKITKAELFWHENELIMSKGENYLTYQFHPESIGTTYPEIFFKPLESILL